MSASAYKVMPVHESHPLPCSAPARWAPGPGRGRCSRQGIPAGARQLFWADVHSAAQNFKPLFDFLATEVVHAPDEERVRMLPHTTWAGLQSVVACFLPLYLPPQVCRCSMTSLKT